MKKIFYVARNELYTLFYSPIAWFLMAVFLIMTSANYINLMDFFQGSYFKGGYYLMLVYELTSRITSEDPRVSYFFKIIGDLYMFLPLITMALLSRETSSGTIKLLYSSPIKIRQIVLGKYVAMLCFVLCLVALCAITSIALCISISSPDYGIIISSLFGLFLILATYSSIGLFISALTSYQIVAAIATLAVFGLISQIGNLWQDVDIVQNITFYLNLPMKSYNILRGLINLRDIAYFLIIIGSFLAFATIKLKSATESISKTKKTLRYLTVIGIATVIACVTEMPSVNIYADATLNDRFTITHSTQKMLAKLDDAPLEITVFANLLDKNYGRMLPTEQNLITAVHLEPYIRFKRDTKVNFVYYYNLDSESSIYKTNPGKSLKEIALKHAETFRRSLDKFLTPAEAAKLADINAEDNRNFILFKYKDKKAVVRTFDDVMFWPREEQFAAAINRLVSDPPKIVFLCDEIARGPFSVKTRDYKKATIGLGNRRSLINMGFDLDTVSLLRNDIPEAAAAVVLSDPRTYISEIGLKKINDYIDSGGNMFIAAETDRKEVIKPVLDKLGISLRPGMLIQPDNNFSNDNVFPEMTEPAMNFSPEFKRFLADQRRYFGDSVFRVLMPGASALQYEQKNGFTIEPLLVSNKTLSWNRVAAISPDSLHLKVSRRTDDEQQNFATSLKMRRTINGKEQRVIVSGDADFLIDALPRYDRRMYYNEEFGSWCFSHFTYGKFPSNTLRPESKDNSFTITSKDIPKQKLVLYWIIPAIIGITGSVLLVRRKRK